MKRISSICFMALAAVLVAVAVAGCGGSNDGEDSSGDPKAEIETVIVETFGTTDPATVCEENVTEAALEAGYKGEDHEARVEACKEDEPVTLKEITVSNVKVNGSTATADLTHTNQNGGRVTFKLSLRDEDGWKVDKVTGG